jgi:hypothetical protein
VEGPGVTAGLSVIVGTTDAAPAAANNGGTPNPLQPTGRRSGRVGPPGPF